MLVAQPVSSMKISFSGSRRSWPSRQRCRAKATSGRACSLARTVFFKSEPQAQQKTRHGALAGLYPLRGKLDAELLQRDIGLLADPCLQPIRVRNKRGPAAASMRLDFRTALRAKDLHPFDSGRSTDIEYLGLRPRRLPLFDGTDKPDPKILRISHRCPQSGWGQIQLLRPFCESLTIPLIREPL